MAHFESCTAAMQHCRVPQVDDNHAIPEDQLLTPHAFQIYSMTSLRIVRKQSKLTLDLTFFVLSKSSCAGLH